MNGVFTTLPERNGMKEDEFKDMRGRGEEDEMISESLVRSWSVGRSGS